MKITATRKLEFDAGHRVLGHKGKCQHPHGHHYVAEITVSVLGLNSLGMVIDFGIIKERMGKWIDEYWDHNFLFNSLDPLYGHVACLTNPLERVRIWSDREPYIIPQEYPTAEVLAKLLFNRAIELLPEVSVESVKIWETPNSVAEFSA